MTVKEHLQQGSENLLNIYFTAGYPKLDDTAQILQLLDNSGVDLIEIGIPYSDPLSDGPTIQASSQKALENGMTLDYLFQQIKGVNIKAGLLLMGYFNTVLQYGIEAFCKACKETGVTAVIIPDLPIELYATQYKDIFNQYELSLVFLVSPNTSEERIKYIDEHSSTFIYAVSSASTTGKNKSLDNVHSYLNRLQNYHLKHPILVGFNIKNNEDFARVNQYARGGIIGSAFIQHITENPTLETSIPSFIQSIRL